MCICTWSTVSTLGGIYVLTLSGICKRETYVCLMSSPRGNVSIIMCRALHALRVLVFYQVLSVLPVHVVPKVYGNVMCVKGMVYTPGGKVCL